ncbi:MAG: hypothetical protein V4447_09845 [Pseudomonadota bacterium]
MNTFIVGDAFPVTSANVALMQLWIATRHVLVLQRALLAKPGPDLVEHEQFLHTFLAITATLKEAADAFCLADSLGSFSAASPDLSSELALARKECNESDASSLHKQVLVRLRNTAGAHFGTKLIEKGLSALSSQSLPLRVGGTSFFESTFPLATSLIENILESHGITQQDALRVFPAVINLGAALQKIADAAITISARLGANSAA